MNKTLIHFRNAVRTILLTPDNKVLLMKINSPDSSLTFWITPGGGMENDENLEEAVKRELNEELGLTDFNLGPLVWLRQHTFNWGKKRICQDEQYYIVHIKQFDPVISDKTEAEFLHEFRWWCLSDMEKSEEIFTPGSIVNIINSYLESGPPRESPEVEILVD
jgi:8-oxo-dGTP pyrophosphatase MutT (NUDIX family)